MKEQKKYKKSVTNYYRNWGGKANGSLFSLCSIGYLNLSELVCKKLRSININRVIDLTKYSKKELLEKGIFNDRDMVKIEQAIKEAGYQLKG